MWIADVARCRQADRRATEEFGVASMVLMERAGLAVFQAVRELLGPRGSVAVVCGPGNNGGDGLVVARLCFEAGYAVEAISTAPPDEMSPECREQWVQATASGVRFVAYGETRWLRRMQCLAQADLVVDAVLGIGVKGEVRGPAREAIEYINRSGVPVLAVDVPSGIDADTGAELGEAVWATRTVTFAAAKPFLFQSAGLERSGHWTVAEIGIPSELLSEPTGARLTNPTQVAGLLPERFRGSHKGSNGHVLVVAGCESMRGAAVLCAKSALRAGAGMVTVASVEPVLESVIAHAPECCLMPLPMADGVVSADASDTVLRSQSRFDAAVFGPGLTHQPEVMDLLRRVWSRWETPAVIDADALNAVSEGIEPPPCEALLTPHPGETSRMLGRPVHEVQADRFAAVLEAVARYRRAVLLKGAFSIVGAEHEPLVVNTTGNPGMASAGVGDVLSGVAGALIGQGLGPFDAGVTAAYWHGLAGDWCASEIGPVGYTALDVCDAIPRARAKLAACGSELDTWPSS